MHFCSTRAWLSDLRKERNSLDEVKIGVIGVGRIGRLHVQNLQSSVPRASVISVSDVSQQALESVSKEFGVAQATTDYRVLLENEDIDAVVICSPTDTHDRLIIEAAESGKHVFCEKPIALDLQRIDRALEAVKKSGVKLMVGFNRRFDPSFRKARELVLSGAIGRPHVVRITSRDPQPPPLSYVKVSGGLFLDMTIHDFDMIRYVSGREVKSVSAAGGCLIDPAIGDAGDIDTAVVTLRFDDGTFGVIDNSRQAVYGYDQRIEVLCSDGCVMVGNPTPTEVVVADHKSVSGDRPLHFFVERYRDAFVEEMRHFVDCILNDQEPIVGGDDGRIAVQLAYAANESLLKGVVVEM